MVLLAPDREALEQWGEAIDTFLRQRLHLRFRPELTTPPSASFSLAHW